MDDNKYILRLFNGNVDTTNQRITFLKNINSNFQLYHSTSSDAQNDSVLNSYYKICEERVNCLAFIHYTQFPDVHCKFSEWSEEYRKYLFVVIFSGGLIGEELKSQILDKAKKINYQGHVFILQRRFDQLSGYQKLLREFIDAFISFSINQSNSLDEVHKMFEKINYDPDVEYLYALYFLCQGYLTVYIIHKYDSLAVIPQMPEEIKDALGNLGINNIIQNEFILDLKNKFGEVTTKNYWMDVFDNPEMFEETVTREWNGLTNGEEIPQSFNKFIIFLQGGENAPSPSLIAKLYNDISDNLRTKI